jgi:hypothetical protein
LAGGGIDAEQQGLVEILDRTQGYVTDQVSTIAFAPASTPVDISLLIAFILSGLRSRSWLHKLDREVF